MRHMYADKGYNKFECVVVEDLEQDNAFDEAVKGVE